jgi:hypothetical protein
MSHRDDLTDPLEAELAQLLAAEKPVPRPEFVRELDSRVAARFPRKRAHRRHSWLWRPQFAIPAGGFAAAVVAIVVIASSGGNKNGSVTSFDSSGTRSEKLAAPAPTAAGPSRGPSQVGAPSAASGTASSSAAHAPAPKTQSVAPVPPPPSAVAPARQRRVERTTDLTVSVPRTQMQDAAQQVFGIVTAAGGVVQSSNVASGEGAGASFDLRVPSGRVTQTVARLAKLGHVRSETNSTLDVTKSYTSLSTRLADAGAERRGLLRRLAKAVTQNETDSIKARLRLVESQINGLQSSLRALRNRTDYARVSLELVPRHGQAVVPVHHGSRLTPARALHDAGRVLAVAGAVGLLALIVALPLAALALLGWLAARPFKRRRREQALDLA